MLTRLRTTGGQGAHFPRVWLHIMASRVVEEVGPEEVRQDHVRFWNLPNWCALSKVQWRFVYKMCLYIRSFFFIVKRSCKNPDLSSLLVQLP